MHFYGLLSAIRTVSALLLLPAFPGVAAAQNTFPWPSAGNVGIGTDSPSQQLHVFSNSSIFSLIEGTSPGIDVGLVIKNDAAAGQQWSLRADNAGSVMLRNDFTANQALTILSNGNIGIGTTGPGDVLHVDAGSSPNAGLRVSRLSATNQPYTYFDLNTSGTPYFGIQSGDNVAFRALALNPLGGFVGIGTTTPCSLTTTSAPGGCKLSVAGAITAQEVVVSASGADYVFDPAYRLAPLKEVADYIEANHHLPEIPAAADMSQNGVSVGDLQTKLLAKIEELTLHMIEAEKENQTLRDRLAKVEVKLEAATSGNPRY